MKSFLQQLEPYGIYRLVHARTATIGELCGPCPWCNGTDRFRVFYGPYGTHYWCRVCARQGNAAHFDEIKPAIPVAMKTKGGV